MLYLYKSHTTYMIFLPDLGLCFSNRLVGDELFSILIETLLATHYTVAIAMADVRTCYIP